MEDSSDLLAKMALEAPYRLPGKIKEKTRGQASETPTITENEEAIPDEDDIEMEKIPVNVRALRVFGTLFFDPSTRTTPGEIS